MEKGPETPVTNPHSLLIGMGIVMETKVIRNPYLIIDTVNVSYGHKLRK